MSDHEHEHNSECGHEYHLAFPPEIDRDITAIVAAILQDQTVEDFVTIVADENRLPALLLRACQIIVQLLVQVALLQDVPPEQVGEYLSRHVRHVLLEYAKNQDQGQDQS